MAISKIQSHMQEQRWADAADGLSALYARWDDLNDFEKSTLLNFYTNLFLANNMFGDAILTFEAILEIPSLRQDIELRSLRALGQLNMAEENYAESIAFYNAFLDVSEERDGTVLLGLANSHYSLGEFEDAIPHLIEHIEILQAQEASVDRNKYGLLNLLYVESGDLDAAVHTTQTMIDQYNEPADWRNLGALYSSAGEPVLHEELLRQAREAGHLDANGVWSDRRP